MDTETEADLRQGLEVHKGGRRSPFSEIVITVTPDTRPGRYR
jgi:hypothetical protein